MHVYRNKKKRPVEVRVEAIEVIKSQGEHQHSQTPGHHVVLWPFINQGNIRVWLTTDGH